MKKQITLRVDGKVLDWYKSQGKGYHSLMNQVLCVHYQGKIVVERAVSKIRKVWKDDEDLSGASGSEDEFIEMKPIKLPKKDEIIPKLKKKIERVVSENRTVGDYYRPNPKQGKKAKK